MKLLAFQAGIPIGQTNDGKDVYASRPFLNYVSVQLFDRVGGSTGALGPEGGGTGITTIPQANQILVGTGSGYRLSSLLPDNATPGFTGDVTSSDGTTVLALADVTAAGTYSNPTITVDTKGRVTSATGGGAEISITGTATLTISRGHVCSGAAADYTVTLPSATAGQSLTVRMSPSLTRWVTITSAALIDGAGTRKMWAGESATLMYDGSTWTKVSGKSIPVTVLMKRTTAQSIPANAFTFIQTTTSVLDSTAGLAVPCGDTANGRFACARSGTYQCAGFVSMGGLTAGVDVYGGVAANAATPNDSPNAYTSAAVGASGFAHLSGSGAFGLAVGSYVAATALQGDSAARNTRAVSPVLPTLSVAEVVSW